MSKKKPHGKQDQNFEPESNDAGINPVVPNQAVPESEASNSSPESQEITEAVSSAEESVEMKEPLGVEDKADLSEDSSFDDILDDVRHSLIEEELNKEEKKPTWWNRLIKGAPKSETVDVAEEDEQEVLPPVASAVVGVNESHEEPQELEQIDELIKLLETDIDEDQSEVETAPVSVLEPTKHEVNINVDELKRQAFGPRPKDEHPDEYSEVRKVALGEDEDVFVEVESKAADPLDEQVKVVENALRPYRRYIYYGLAFIGVIMAIMASTLVYKAYETSLPTPSPTAAANMPFPTMLSLPGGLNFDLGKGALKDGEWNPLGPEWLEGTEICRWVAIPWSLQLEAAVRTMNRNDTINLLMSNNDTFTYNVSSIKEMTFPEIQKLDSNTPCLILILSKQQSETRWVVLGNP